MQNELTSHKSEIESMDINSNSYSGEKMDKVYEFILNIQRRRGIITDFVDKRGINIQIEVHFQLNEYILVNIVSTKEGGLKNLKFLSEKSFKAFLKQTFL